MPASEAFNLFRQCPLFFPSNLHHPAQQHSALSKRSYPYFKRLWVASGCLSLGCVVTALPNIHPFLVRAIGVTWQANFVFVLAALMSALLLANLRFTQPTRQAKWQSNSPNWLLRSSMVVVILTVGIIFSILTAPSVAG